jgi:hypothetical protein
LAGKKAAEALPGIEKDPADWNRVKGKVVTSRESVKFENYAQQLQKWFAVSAFAPRKNILQ